jgi:hypothetical protein
MTMWDVLSCFKFDSKWHLVTNTAEQFAFL